MISNGVKIGVVPKPSYEGQAAKNGHGVAVRDVHGSNVSGNPLGGSNGKFATSVPRSSESTTYSSGS